MISQDACRNRLLSMMSAEDFGMLSPHFEQVDLKRSQVLIKPDEPIAFAIFLEEGLASMVLQSPEGHSAEGGIIGREGFVTPVLAMGSDRTPNRIEIQIEGNGFRIERERLATASADSATLRGLLLRFAQVLSIQAAYTSLSNAVHHIDERLARWLLMCHDRCSSDDIPITHEYLSVMLAVRRPSVTTALHVLEGNGFITAERGNILIRKRALLEEFAGDAYGKPEKEYCRLMGPIK